MSLKSTKNVKCLVFFNRHPPPPKMWWMPWENCIIASISLHADIKLSVSLAGGATIKYIFAKRGDGWTDTQMYIHYVSCLLTDEATPKSTDVLPLMAFKAN